VTTSPLVEVERAVQERAKEISLDMASAEDAFGWLNGPVALRFSS